MATKKKLLQAAAGGAGGAGLDITEVFSTYLYEGNGDPNYSNTKTITNGIDLDGEGGLVWIKKRTSGGSGVASHFLFDTVRGSGNPWNYLKTDSTAAENADSNTLTSFNSNGFSLAYKWWVNENNEDYASWTFRKAPKFFDCITWTGDGTGTRAISHTLDTTVGMLLVKRTSDTEDWTGYHRGVNGGVTPQNYKILINSTAAAASSAHWASTAPTTTTFTVSQYHNVSGATYVAYLFAHNDGDGTFGPDSDQDIIKCGSYTGNGSTTGPVIDLGFEPQWVLIKNASAASRDGVDADWLLYDVMRGMGSGGYTNENLRPNTSAAESADNFGPNPTPTGFTFSDNNRQTNYSGDTFIFMAVRRGQLALPEVGTDVFMPLTYTATGSAGNKQTTGFPVDLTLIAPRSGTDAWKHAVISRLTGGDDYLSTNSTAAEVANGSGINLDDMTGYDFDGAAFNNSSDMYNLNWKRAPSYFDCVAYSGNSTAGRAVSHNVLGVAPEMIWVKNRNGASGGARPWIVYHKDTGNTGYLKLNEGSALITSDPQSKFGNGTVGVSPTASDFTVASDYEVNYSGDTYIAYLFATLAGVSKVGSYVGLGAGNPLTIDCGFTSGARFVLIKKTDAATGSAPDGSWFVFDSVRGITASTDPYLQLNTTSAEASNFSISPHSSGFTVIQDGPTELNQTGKNYIFYAIA